VVVYSIRSYAEGLEIREDPMTRACPSRVRCRLVRTFGLCLLSLLVSGKAPAQLLRAGPFEISPNASVEGIYSSNVEGVRESDAEEEREDYFVIFGGGATIEADLSPNWFVGTDLNLEVERHFNRTDLDTDSIDDLFGNITFVNDVTRGRYELSLLASYERAREVREDTFISGSFQTRDPVELLDVDTVLSWSVRELTLVGGYAFSRERHDEEEFEEGDSDEHLITFSADYTVNSRIDVFYDYERERTDLINQEDAPGNEEWLDTDTVGLRFQVVPEQPDVVYTLAAEREDDVDEEGEFELIHSILFNHEWDITGTINLRANVDWTFEEEEEEDDVSFVYNLTLTHLIGQTARQIINFSQEPRDTFGSTQDTESLAASWRLTKDDLFIEGMSLATEIGYTRDEPSEADAETEEAWTYEVTVAYSEDITRSITRTLEYSYFLEDLNTEEEILDEHRVSLTLDYDF